VITRAEHTSMWPAGTPEYCCYWRIGEMVLCVITLL